MENKCYGFTLTFPESPIFRFIIAVVVYAIYAVFARRPWSHIRQERQKIIPPFANFNTATAIAMVVLTSSIVTSPTQPNPRIVFWRIA